MHKLNEWMVETTRLVHAINCQLLPALMSLLTSNCILENYGKFLSLSGFKLDSSLSVELMTSPQLLSSSLNLCLKLCHNIYWFNRYVANLFRNRILGHAHRWLRGNNIFLKIFAPCGKMSLKIWKRLQTITSLSSIITKFYIE
jgi:hypothetical protein